MTDTYAEILVPDTIEPLYGWKALKIRSDGRLESPQQKTIWPVKKRLQAACAKKHNEYKWTPVGGKPKPHPKMGAPTPQNELLTNTTATAPAFMEYDPIPVTVLPEGLSWSWEPVPHQVASKSCTCGIYIVNDVKKAASYLAADCILAEIVLWGHVVPGSEGARGEYAYPRQLFAPDKLADVATMVAQLYQVPIGYREHRTGKTITYEQAIENLEQMKAQLAEAKKPKPFVQNPPTQIPNVIVPKSPTEIPNQPPAVTYQITSGSNTLTVDNEDEYVEDNRADRAVSRVITIICLLMLITMWLSAMLVHPLTLIGALPFMIMLPISAHNGWARK